MVIFLYILQRGNARQHQRYNLVLPRASVTA
ncbi:hypothetical protein EM595_2328 [Duffyella gerundensis]|uniref:Uncharacterized protein n=1 Tax=Duffyella gerundensis TaxID=1619313 RepID=A0A0U5GNB0_9GAMM|nr:hypothetical protein EM595_2328 [Duffyella gerundensis]